MTVKEKLEKHAGVIGFGGIGVFVMVIHFLIPTPSNVVSYTDQYMYNLPLVIGPFVIFCGFMIDMLNNMLD